VLCCVVLCCVVLCCVVLCCVQQTDRLREHFISKMGIGVAH